MDIKTALARIVDRIDLSLPEMQDVMRSIMTGAATDAQIAAFVMGLRMKGESLDEIEGVGPGRKKALLHAFGSAKGVSRASLADLVKVDGINQPLAERIHAFFRKS